MHLSTRHAETVLHCIAGPVTESTLNDRLGLRPRRELHVQVIRGSHVPQRAESH